MNSKLGMAGAYNRSRDQTAKTGTKLKTQYESATINGLENEIKSLREQNISLKKELLETRQTVRQIFSESSHEHFDERRINMIKFQVIQLERQISLLTEALGSRSDAILEVENTMAWLADTLRSYLASEVQGSMISISRKDLMALIESSESARIKLFKCIENVNKDEVGKELLVLNPFLAGRGKQGESVSLLDICLHRLDYLNLRHVAQTESKLCSLYKELIRIHNQLEYLQSKGKHNLLLTAHIASAEMERTRNSLLKTSVVIKDVADDLLAISLLCPSAPWPVLKRPLSRDIPVERVLEALPPLPSSKQAEVKHVISTSLGVCNHRVHLLEEEKAALNEELSFYKMVYDLQMQYTQAVFDAMKTGYREFEDTVKDQLSKPVKSLLEAYNHLKHSASETAFRNILLIFKENEAQLASIIEMFDCQDQDDETQRHKALSLFGEEFMKKVDLLLKSHKKKLEPSVRDKRDVKEEQRRLEVELSQLIEELEEKYGRQWVSGYKKNQNLAVDQSNSLASSPKMEGIDSNCEKSDLSCEISVGGRSELKDKPPEDLNPSGLRSFLDDDYRNLDKERKGSSKSRKPTHDKEKWANADGKLPSADGQRANQSENRDSAQIGVLKSVRKKDSKTVWKPEKDWVNNFSVPTPVSDELDSASCLSNGSPHLHREESWQSDKDSDGVFSLPHLTKKKVKTKENLTYEPNLSVAQGSLNLRREGSVSTDFKGKTFDRKKNKNHLL